MYIDKLIKKEVITLLISVAFLVVVFIGVTFAKFLSVDKGEKTVINMGDLNISFCNDSSCDTTYSNIGQVIGTKVENGTTVPASIYPFPNDGTYSNETPYIFKVENTGTLDSTVKIKLKEDATYTPTGDYSSYTRLSLKYPEHLKVAIRKKVTFEDTGYQLGDVNMDGIVNKEDVELISKYNLSLLTGTETFNNKLADINEDGKITGSDATRLNAAVLGKLNDIYSTKIYTYTDLEDGVIFKDDIIKAGESETYFLWLYLDESTPNDVQNTFFVGNIDVEGEFVPKATPISFSTDSWETIITAVRKGNISKYNVGDTRTIDMGTYGTHTLRIANTSTPDECKTEGFSQSACGFVLEFADIITTHNMNPAGTYSGAHDNYGISYDYGWNVDGWPATSMRTFVNNDIYNVLPSNLKGAIIDTTVVSSHGSTSGETNFTSTDKLYLLAPKEIYANFSDSADTAKELTRTLDYYKNIGVTASNDSGTIKKNGTEDYYWWLRSASSGDTERFFAVLSIGTVGVYHDSRASITWGVSPAFRIG